MAAIHFPCRACGRTYRLDDDYLARYSGQVTVCTGCQAQMVLPDATAGGPPPVPWTEPSGAAGQVLSYATPRAAQQRFATSCLPVWRDRGTIVTRDATELPAVCVKCGAPAERGKRYRRTYYWHEPAYYLAILAGLLLYVIIALVVRKKGTVRYSLCEGHVAKRRTGILAGWGVVGAGILLFVAAAQGVVDEPAGLVAVGIVAVIGGLILASLAARTLYPQKIQEGHLWLKGSGRAFREMWPLLS